MVSCSSFLQSIERKGKGIFSQITKTQQTIICASTGIVVLLLLVSIVVQVKQPRKKVSSAEILLSFSHCWCYIGSHCSTERFKLLVIFHYYYFKLNNHTTKTPVSKVLARNKNLYDPADLQEVFDPPRLRTLHSQRQGGCDLISVTLLYTACE